MMGKMWNKVEFVWIDVKMMWKNVENMWFESEVDEKNREVAQFFPKAILGVSAPITKWNEAGKWLGVSRNLRGHSEKVYKKRPYIVR